MLGKKGQASSVFELMIAGVVAFAILIILLTIVFKVDPDGGYSSARDVIGNSIKAASPSGQATIANFKLDKDGLIGVEDLAVKTSLDADSIFFLKGELGSNPAIEVSSSTPGKSYMKYSGTGITMSAMVLCKSTASALDESLPLLGDKYDFTATTAMDYCGDATPCCAVILKRQQ
ncbi:MAG: hypothetical protein WC462_05195 [archaeon]